MKRIYLIDCPGVVPPSCDDSDEDILLRGVVRVENVEHPAQYIGSVLKRCKAHHLERTYGIGPYDDANGFLEKLALKGGRLMKGGEPDKDGVAKMVLNDFMRGKIPWFTAPHDREAPDGDGTPSDEQHTTAHDSFRDLKRKRADDDLDGTDVSASTGEPVRRQPRALVANDT